MICGYFDPLNIPLKVAPHSWVTGSDQIWVRSFKWGTVNSCRLRGYKNIRGQSWRLKKNHQLGRIRQCRSKGPAVLADFFSTSNFDSVISAAPWPKSMFSTSLRRSNSYLFGSRVPRAWLFMVSVGQKATKLLAMKVGGVTWQIGRFFSNLHLWQLVAQLTFDSQRPRVSTPLKRSKPYCAKGPHCKF